MGALILGTALAVAALAFVLYPVFFGVARRRVYQTADVDATDRTAAVAALREIEFDRATGKLSDSDYEDLKSRYTAQAIAAMRREAGAGQAGRNSELDEVELALRAYRAAHPACPEHGIRPEDDAVFCSACGRYLHDRCAVCGAPVDALDARYCVNCGDRLAA